LLHQITARHLRLAVASYLLCLLVVTSLVVLTYRSPGQLLLYLPIILIASALTDPRGLGVTTGLAVLTTLAVGVQIQAPAGDLMMALFMLLITALTTWLSTRRTGAPQRRRGACASLRVETRAAKPRYCALKARAQPPGFGLRAGNC
jgi:hypothetical protein